MRGKGKNRRSGFPHTGITPAYAGKSRCNSGMLHKSRDHPRLCGEKLERAGCKMCRKGSPPPMRGKDANASKAIADHGITPAYAGKSDIVTFCEFVIKDHPRLCGEKSSFSRHYLYDQGSPPPMRGKVAVWFPQTAFIRITPAYAGKSDTCQPPKQ